MALNYANAIDRLIDDEINNAAGEQSEKANPYDKPAEVSFYKWLETINTNIQPDN